MGAPGRGVVEQSGLYRFGVAAPFAADTDRRYTSAAHGAGVQAGHACGAVCGVAGAPGRPATLNHKQLPDLRLDTAGAKGRGLFTDADVPCGAVVLAFGGPRLRTSEVPDFSRAIQVGADTFLGQSHDVDDYVNHSCAPNCRIREHDGQVQLVALRPIARGEEITFDYSTCMLSEPELEACHCGAESCRGRIASFVDLTVPVQAHLPSPGRRAVVPPRAVRSGGTAPGRDGGAQRTRPALGKPPR